MTLIRQKEAQKEPQKKPAKTAWEIFMYICGGALAIVTFVSLLFAVLLSVPELKELFIGQPKPQLLRAENCRFSPDGRQVEFELLVNNLRSTDISLISLNMILLDSFEADLHFLIDLPNFNFNSKPFLPLTISSGQTVRIRSVGDFAQYHNDKEFREKWELRKDQNTVEGTAVAEFNTNDVIRKKIIFTNKRPQH